MASVQRAFAQKLSKQHAADVRRNVSVQSSSSFKSSPISGCSSSISLNDLAEPLDFEDFLTSHQLLIDRDPLRNILDFPHTDVEVCTVRRKIRTCDPIVPEEDISELLPRIQACIQCYTSDWRIVRYCFRQYSSSNGPQSHQNGSRLAILQTSPRQEFEIDTQQSEIESNTPVLKFDYDSSSVTTPTSGRQSIVSTSSSSCATDATLTPRNSWASFDLRNSISDPLLVELFDRTAPEQLDQLNEQRRKEQRQEYVFYLYPPTDEASCIERRLPADIPEEHQGHRILVKCLMMKLELEVEPFFASMALYDAKEKRKLSENFYFDMNPEQVKRMLGGHIPYSDVSTLSRSCIFDITTPTSDLFIVIKLEKVLQGDINECAEPYMKDDKNHRDKLKLNAVGMCDRLGKYRQPFAWTAISLINVITGVSSLERVNQGGDQASPSIDRVDSSSPSGPFMSGTNSLERKTSSSSLEQLRRRATDVGGSLTRRGSLERRAVAAASATNTSQQQELYRRSHSPDYLSNALDSFRPITINVSNFFKQESERLRDEDLYKFLQELKRPCSVMKKLKCIPGTLKLDISPCPEEVKCALTPDLHKLFPYNDDKCRPTKELLEFPLRDILAPHYLYKNMLFVNPKELNFSNRTGSARNIAVKVQLMSGEQMSSALPNIYGKSSCPEYTSEAYTAISYHNKCPTFYDEIKMKLPAHLTQSHHILFTIYHISCQRKQQPEQQTSVDTPVGYTWLPILRDGMQLVSGEFCLPVMLEPPPPNYSYIPTDVCLPGTKWLDNHKGVFTVIIQSESSLHTQDKYLEHFLNTCDWLESGEIPTRIGEQGVELELRRAIQDLPNTKTEAFVKFLPLIFDYLLRLLVHPPYLPNVHFNHHLNLSTAAFETICKLINNISTELQSLQDCPTVDQHGRHSLLTAYIQYQSNIPHPLANNVTFSTLTPSDNLSDERSQSCRKTHEELALQWVVSSGLTKDLAMANSWILFELIIKSMGEHLAYTKTLDVPRKLRFSEQFIDDILTLTQNVTSEIISHYQNDVKLAGSLNCSLAFFLYDLSSLMDRGFVLNLIRTYCKQVIAKIHSLPDAAIQLLDFKLDFLRIICSHEHFVPLNLPFGTPYTQSSGGGAVSPNPSITSSISQTSFLSSCTGTSGGGGMGPHQHEARINFGELSTDFRQQHFLVGLLLTDLTNVFDIQNPSLHAKVVDTLRNLLAAHDCDPRYSNPDTKGRVAALYLPLLAIVMDSLPILYYTSSEPHRGNGGNSSDEAFFINNPINQTVAMAIAGTTKAITTATNYYDPYQQNRKICLNAEVTRHLLICFLWVVKNIGEDALIQWLSELETNRLYTLLQILHVCISCFEYKGKKELKRRTQQQHFHKSTDIKSRLEDVILGQGSARSEMMQRRKERAAEPTDDKVRWRKEQMAYRSSIDQQHEQKTNEEIEMDAAIEGNLSNETNLIILDTLEYVVQHVVQQVDQPTHKNATFSNNNNVTVITCVLRVLLHGLARNQSTNVLQHMFATQRALVFKFHNVIFDEENELCADLCLLLLRHCGTYMPNVRVQAAASLYLLMRQTFEIGNNFARIKMQVTMSLSSLVGTNTRFSEQSLRRSLKTILEYAENDLDLQDTTFPEQVRDLVFNLYMILSDTVKMKEFQEDPEMLLDLMYRIAKGYQNSPDLRLTWLANMAQKHMERNNHTEAGMCLIHSAALVAEYLAMQESLAHLPCGAVALQKVSPNVLHESAVSDDVISPEQEGVCLGSHFTEAGLLGLLEHAASSLHTAGMFEAINDIYRVLIPIAEHNRDFKKLANIHSKLHDAYTRIEQLHGKRVFGTYFRVGFYGLKFGDLNGEEFIYKEPTLTKLPEIFSRLENFYCERFGKDNIIIIQDSNIVDMSQLDPEKGYIQITYVEPYFELYEMRYRMTHFEKNFNIKRFIYATPFTSSGRAHGELHEQCKRKTILTTAMYFPYVKTRIHVVDRKQIVLSPIEVAIEDIQKKTMELGNATQQEPPDTKILQMVLQGCIGTTVNQGPMEMAQVFLSPTAPSNTNKVTSLTKHQNKLRLCFKDFSKKCLDALKKNKNLIGPDQRDYQRELERNYHRFTERLQPLINVQPGTIIATSNGNGAQRYTSTQATNARVYKTDSPTPLRW